MPLTNGKGVKYSAMSWHPDNPNHPIYASEWIDQLLEITKGLPEKLCRNILDMNKLCWEHMDHMVLYEATFLLIEEYQSGNMDNCVYKDE